MARKRTIITFADAQELARKHAVEMNSMILEQNEKRRKEVEAQMGLLVKEAIGMLELDRLVNEYLRLKAEMTELNGRWVRLMPNTSIDQFTDDRLVEIVNKVKANDKRLPPILYQAVLEAAEGHGLVTEATYIEPVDEKALTDTIRNCETEEEIGNVIMASRANVMKRMGITIEDIARLFPKKPGPPPDPTPLVATMPDGKKVELDPEAQEFLRDYAVRGLEAALEEDKRRLEESRADYMNRPHWPR